MRKCIAFCLVLLFASPVLAQRHSKGLIFDDAEYARVPKKPKKTRSLDPVPDSASIKMYAPEPRDQGRYGTCVAWAAGYCGRTMVEAIKNGWTNRDSITSMAYSPAFLFRLLKPKDLVCEEGTNLASAMQVLKQQGNLTFRHVSDLCIPAISEEQLKLAKEYKIKDYLKLFDIHAPAIFKINNVKKSISEKKPVVVGMICPASFDRAKELWVPSPAEQPSLAWGGHAMCVVGYDDTKYGGAFEIQNSWGRSWGNDGYIWVKYDDFAKFTRYAYEFVDPPAVQPQPSDSLQTRITPIQGLIKKGRPAKNSF